MSDYVQALRSKDETPGLIPAMTKEAEAAILDKYKDEVVAAQEGKHLTANEEAVFENFFSVRCFSSYGKLRWKRENMEYNNDAFEVDLRRMLTNIVKYVGRFFSRQ